MNSEKSKNTTPTADASIVETEVAEVAGVAKRKVNASFMKAMTPSKELAEVIGATPLSRPEVVKQMWVYIKANNLQDTKDKRMINSDAKLKAVFGQDQVSMFQMAKLLSQHLK